MYQLRSDIPLPTTSRRVKYPLGQMMPGDSFFIPGKRGENISAVAARAYSAMQDFRRRGNNSAKFVARRLGTRVGVWRIA